VTYRVRAGGKERSIFIPAEPYKYGISIQGFISDPNRFENVSSSTWKTTTLRITLRNSLTREATATLTIADQGSGVTITNESITIPAGSSVTRSYQWRVRGTGTHTAVATLQEDGTGRAEATVQLTPNTQSLCLIAMLVPGVIMPGICIAFCRRRKSL